MLEKTIASIESLTKERCHRIEVVALILELANTPYDSNSDDRMGAKIRPKETLSWSNKLIEDYLSHMQNKGFLRYHEETQLYIPTDKGMHSLKIYNMLASLLI
jgi:predicted transcriptional regulator